MPAGGIIMKTVEQKQCLWGGNLHFSLLGAWNCRLTAVAGPCRASPALTEELSGSRSFRTPSRPLSGHRNAREVGSVTIRSRSAREVLSQEAWSKGGRGAYMRHLFIWRGMTGRTHINTRDVTGVAHVGVTLLGCRGSRIARIPFDSLGVVRHWRQHHWDRRRWQVIRIRLGWLDVPVCGDGAIGGRHHHVLRGRRVSGISEHWWAVRPVPLVVGSRLEEIFLLRTDRWRVGCGDRCLHRSKQCSRLACLGTLLRWGTRLVIARCRWSSVRRARPPLEVFKTLFKLLAYHEVRSQLPVRRLCH